mmetsp:Transcript_3087/g.6391  ORF Transcript_3087/g.6391 Transcript_3087/m.6391 type:complete len:441 (-) Transcript_3087:18-1340(-)
MADRTIHIQNQIRHNAQSIREYFDDLDKWQDDINSLDAQLAGKKTEAKAIPPVRSEVPLESAKAKESREPEREQTEEEKIKFQRDKAPMKDYYKAWDQFDVDAELSKVEEEAKAPKPSQTTVARESAPKAAIKNTKVVVKGGRTANSELERLKDKGNLFFTQLDFSQALECYKGAFDYNPNEEFRLILHSNSAECYLKLRDYSQAEQESTKALSINPKHPKSLLRRAKACKMLSRFKQALSDIEVALGLDSSNAAVLTEKTQTLKKQAKAKKEILEAMTSKSRAPSHPLIDIKVIEVGADEVPQPKAVQIEEVKKRALDNLSVTSLGQPKTLTEFEKNWATLQGYPEKLMSYLHALDLELLTKLCMKSSVESDFLIRVVKTIEDILLGERDLSRELLAALSKAPRFNLVIKFLTKKEKERIRSLIDRLESPELLGFYSLA